MRLTILKNDNMVYIDGLPLPVDCSSLPREFHALQWYDTWGDVEIKNEQGFNCDNRKIDSLGDYQRFVDAWQVQKVAMDKEAANAAARAAELKESKGGANILVE